MNAGRFNAEILLCDTPGAVGAVDVDILISLLFFPLIIYHARSVVLCDGVAIES